MTIAADHIGVELIREISAFKQVSIFILEAKAPLTIKGLTGNKLSSS